MNYIYYRSLSSWWLPALNDDTKNLTETDTETFFPIPNFPKPIPRLFFRYQIFRNRNRYPQKIGKSFETEKFRNRNVNLCPRHRSSLCFWTALQCARVCVVQMFDFTHPIIYYLLYVKFDLDLAHATLSALFNCPGQLNRWSDRLEWLQWLFMTKEIVPIFMIVDLHYRSAHRKIAWLRIKKYWDTPGNVSKYRRKNLII